MTRPDIDALAALLDKAQASHPSVQSWPTDEDNAWHRAIVAAGPALLAYVRELETQRDAAAIAMREKCAQTADNGNARAVAAAIRGIEP